MRVLAGAKGQYGEAVNIRLCGAETTGEEETAVRRDHRRWGRRGRGAEEDSGVAADTREEGKEGGGHEKEGGGGAGETGGDQRRWSYLVATG